MPTPVEVVVYIHGVSEDLRGKPHMTDYEALHFGVAERNGAFPRRLVGVEWGWNDRPLGADPRPDQLLTRAQRFLGGRVMPDLLGTDDFTLNPARAVINRMRALTLYGFGDMFYYTSAAGKAAVRDAVALQIREGLADHADLDAGEPVSLTLVGHSAGSVVALDFLFALFNDLEDYQYIEPTADQPACDREDADEPIAPLRSMIDKGELRVRRLVTLGSPIPMLACRSDAVVEILASGEELPPERFGLTSQFKKSAAPDAPIVTGARWINIWDRDDPISFPIAGLIAEDPTDRVAEDLHPDVSDSVTKAHTAYWRHKRVHRAIASRW